ESVNLPDTLTKIEDEAFLGCEGLTTISFPAKLKSIGSSAFGSCPLQTIEFATVIFREPEMHGRRSS
ncbi:MAG: leucine-rich repeat domain-containing protein, partial [Oscillospiraceae bacterium]|nr:leucine-rich repeat domain-containing protein [Oscillospiraceae bacterium]